MIQFVKAHAYGNDFLIVDSKMAEREGHRELAIRLCARNTGLGADGVEYLEWTGERAGRVRLFNADGSRAEISGNGTRCVAAWMAYQSQTPGGGKIAVETDVGPKVSTVVAVEGNRYEIASEMGVPGFTVKPLTLADGTVVKGAVVSIGNPHYVLFGEDEEFSVAGRGWLDLGREICHHPSFAEQTNVEFVRMRSAGDIEIRIFERGVGPTTSSGSGTSAAAVAAIMLREAKNDLLVHAPGGVQQVEWGGPRKQLVLTGVAELIAVGDIFPAPRGARILSGGMPPSAVASFSGSVPGIATATVTGDSRMKKESTTGSVRS